MQDIESMPMYKPNHTKLTETKLHNQTYQTKPRLLVKAVNAWVRSALGNLSKTTEQIFSVKRVPPPSRPEPPLAENLLAQKKLSGPGGYRAKKTSFLVEIWSKSALAIQNFELMKEEPSTKSIGPPRISLVQQASQEVLLRRSESLLGELPRQPWASWSSKTLTPLLRRAHAWIAPPLYLQRLPHHGLQPLAVPQDSKSAPEAPAL